MILLILFLNFQGCTVFFNYCLQRLYFTNTKVFCSRWGPNGPTEFKDNMNKLARLFKTSLPESTLVIWATALPVSPDIRSSILLKQASLHQGVYKKKKIIRREFLEKYVKIVCLEDCVS